MILALDISTRVIGYAILDENGKIVKLDHLDLSKIKDGLWAKADTARFWTF